MLKIQNLQVAYGGIQALRGIDMEVPDGKIVTLIGANGAGKSTTLRTISGLVKAKSGSITYNNEQLLGKPINAILAAGIAQRLACFSRQRRGEFLGALAHEVGGLEDDIVALVGREPELTESLLGRVDGRTAFRLACDGNLGNGFVRLFIVDRDGLLGHDFLTADVQGLFFHGNTS